MSPIKKTQAALQKKLDDISAKVKAADDALANPGTTIETIRTSVTDAETALGTLPALNDDVTKAAKPGAAQRPDEKATLLAEYNALKAGPPTLKAVTEKLALADQAKRTLLQPDLDPIKTKLEVADEALGDSAATIETVRTNLATARAEYGKLTELDKKI